MNYLIDTHILLWWLANSKQMKIKTRKILENPENQIFVSSVSVWEIIIKKSLKKLQAPSNLVEMIHHNEFDELPVRFYHAEALEKLQKHHHDPFDRLLIAQSISENLAFISADSQMQKYKTLRLIHA